MKSRARHLFFPILVLGFTPANVRAITWATTYGDWSEAEFWDPKEVPEGTDEVYNGAGISEVTTNAFAWRIYLGASFGATDLIPGSGHIEIVNEGTLRIAGSMSMGSLAQSYGRMLVSGESAGFRSDAENIGIGGLGTGVLLVERGAFFGGTYVALGGSGTVTENGLSSWVAGSGDVEITGIGSTLESLEGLTVGVGGKGKMKIADGGAAFTSGLSLAYDGPNGLNPAGKFSEGELTITGTNSRMEVSTQGGDYFYIGKGGKAKLTIDHGGKLKSEMVRDVVLSVDNVSTSDVLVTGTGSEWAHSKVIRMGGLGTANITIADGGKIHTAGGITIIDDNGDFSRGTLTIQGDAAGSSQNPGVLETFFMSGGDRQAVVFDGAIVRALQNHPEFIRNYGSRTINGGGLAIDSDGHEITVNSVLSGAGPLTKLGAGTLTIGGVNLYQGGTTIAGGTLLAGKNNALGTTGTLTLKEGISLGKSVGTDISLANETVLEANATIVSPGGNFYLGPLKLPAGNHTLTLSPASSNSSTAFTVWAPKLVSGEGNLRLQTSSETVSSSFGLSSFSPANTFSGMLTVGNRVGLKLSGFSVPVISGPLVIDAGGSASLDGEERIADNVTVTINGQLNYGGLNTLTETINRLEGQGGIRSYPATSNAFPYSQVLRVNEGDFSGVLSDGSAEFDPLKFKKIGSGEMILRGASSFSGGTEILAGTLRIENTSGSATGSGIVTVREGGRLTGKGTVGGNVVQSGTLAPGASPGVLSIGGDLAMDATAVTEIEINGTGRGSNHDGVNVAGNLTYGGKLRVIFGGGFTPQSGTPIPIFQIGGSHSGNFQSIEWIGGSATFDEASGAVIATTAPVSPFAGWATLHNLDPATTGAPGFDADNDGLKNMVEFVLDSDPQSGVTANLPTMSMDEAHLIFTYVRRKNLADYFVTNIELSALLEEGTWATVPAYYLTVTSIDDEHEQVTATVPFSFAAPPVFGRVSVTEIGQ